MGRRLDNLDRVLERAVTVLFGPQSLGYRPAPGLWAKLLALPLQAVVVRRRHVVHGPDPRVRQRLPGINQTRAALATW